TPNLSKLLQAFFVGVVYWLVLSIGLMVVLSALGIDVTPIFALVGGASFILAFALQSSLSNLAAGLMIMINRPFDEGDYVSVAGVAGTVKAVSVMSTTVTTPDNQVIVIPNASVWGDVITNVTTSSERRVDLVFGIGYADDMDRAAEVLREVVAAHPLVLKEPEPMIRVGALGASSVDFICRPWVKGADYWTVYWDLQQQVKAAFDAAGISIPFPQQDVHLNIAGGAVASALAGAAAAPAPSAPAPAPSAPAQGSEAQAGDGRDAAEARD
ncbi:MAG: mechanosensitive ion channel family protein, partial [Pseudomonadota bacterium]